MPTIDEDINALSVALTQVRNRETERLTHRADLGELQFSDCLPALNQARMIAERVAGIDLRLCPQPWLRAMTGKLSEHIKSFGNIGSFRINVAGASNLRERRDEIASQAQLSANELLVAAAPQLIFGVVFNGDLQSLIGQGGQYVRNLDNMLQSTQKAVSDKIKEADEALAKAREVAGAVAIGAHTKEFRRIAGRHSLWSAVWMGISAIVIAGTGFVAFKLLDIVPHGDSFKDVHVMSALVSKAIIISLGYMGIVSCVRNYKAHRHLQVINQHKSSSLATFEAFVAAGASASTKDVILMEAARSIFGPVQTGYLGAEESDPSARVIEIMKSFGGQQ